MIAVAIVLPSFIIQTVWNLVQAANIDRDLSIEIWQAGLLWGAMLSLLYMSGIFQFKLNFKSLESIDLDTITDPELREEIERLQLQAQETKSQQGDKQQVEKQEEFRD